MIFVSKKTKQNYLNSHLERTTTPVLKTNTKQKGYGAPVTPNHAHSENFKVVLRTTI